MSNYVRNFDVKNYLNRTTIPQLIANNMNGCFFLKHGVYGESAHDQHVRRTLTLTLTHTITAYSVNGNVVLLCILICATRQMPDIFL